MVRSLISCLALSLTAASAAAAAPVTFAFSGTIDSVASFDAAFIDDPSGAMFTGQFTFDSAAPDGALDPDTGAYTGAAILLELTNQSFNYSPVSIGVANDFAGLDQYLVGYSDFSTTNLSLRLEDLDQAVFANDDLPISPPSLAAFESRFFFFQLFDPDFNLLVDVNGTVESLTCTAGCGGEPPPVPEPATAWLLAVGLGALLRRRREREPR